MGRAVFGAHNSVPGSRRIGDWGDWVVLAGELVNWCTGLKLKRAQADREVGKCLQFGDTLLNDNPLIGDDGNSGRGRDALLRPCRECGPTAIFSRRTDDSGLVVLLANPSQ